MQSLTLTKKQQQEFANEMNTRLGRLIMSWNQELKRWYITAFAALKFANVRLLDIPQNKFCELLMQEKQGLNLNTVMILINNCEDRSAHEMEVTVDDWAEFLLLNHKISLRWKEMQMPVYKDVYKSFELMINKPKLSLT